MSAPALVAGGTSTTGQLPLIAAQLARAHGYRGVVGIGPMAWAETRLTYPALELIELVRGGAAGRPARASWSHRQVAWDPSASTPPVASDESCRQAPFV